jgi:hypothetical protein
MATVDRDAAGWAAGRGARPAEPAPASLVQMVQELLHELPGLLSERVELLALELRRAGMALARIVAFVVAAAILGVTAWLGLWAVVVGLMVGAGLHWAAALGLAILVNAAVAVFAVLQVRGLARLLALPATRRHLTVQAAPAPASTPSTHDDDHRPAAAAG